MNYFYIINGTQLLNAVEYLHQQRLVPNNNVLVLICVTDLVWYDLNNALEQNGNWDKVISLYPLWMLKINRFSFFRLLTSFYAKFKLKRLALTEADNIVFGNYKNIFCRYIAKKSKASKLTIIDDGPSTLDFFKPMKVVGSRSNTLIEYVFNVKQYKIQPNVIFTRYYDQIKEDCINSKIKVLKNSFARLKKNILHKQASNNKFFIGYPIVEENILNTEEYIELLTKLKDKTGSFIYIPHRRENKRNLKLISKNFELKKLGIPFELYLNNSKIYPDEIIGFFTTIFFNVHEMFGEKIKLKFIKLNNLNIGHINNSETLYEEIAEIAEKILSYDLKSISV